MRSQLPKARSSLDSHPGLLLQRYVAHPADGSELWTRAKQDVHAAARGALPCQLYETAFARWEKLLTESNATTNVLQTAGRLIVGLGTENVLETGIRLHHTYGLPIIPGCALKGLAAHYCDQAWGPEDQKFKKPTRSEDEAYRKFLAGDGPRPDDNFHRLLFGNTDDSGCIVFHDAWFVPGSEKEPLKLDVMTPHHSGWNNVENPEPPTDFDSPIPVPFLSVTGKFLVAVSWHGLEHNQAGKWTELARSLLCDALREWGIGAKTTSGYGRLVLPPAPPPPLPPQRRASGAKAKVQIISSRPKGGFNVQDVEPGRGQGTLTLGTPPANTDTNPGEVVDVLVHVDELKRPQYKWPRPS